MVQVYSMSSTVYFLQTNMSLVKFVNIDNLRIARENMGLDSFEVSKKLSKAKELKDMVAEWEAGTSLPKWSQLETLASLYDISELLLCSNENIQRHKSVPDYRTSSNKGENVKISKLINLVISRQKWLEKALKEKGAPKNSLQSSGKDIKDPRELAEFITEKLDIKLEEIKGFSGVNAKKKTLNYLLKKAEDRGIFIGKTVSYHDIKIEEMRGLFISNEYCPFIIINRKDAESAQIFSFVHELAHLFRKTDSISNSLEFRSFGNEKDSEEVFCNKVAAELLLPIGDLKNKSYDRNDIEALASLYKVSRLFIFYRLKDLGKIERSLQERLEKEIVEETERNVIEMNAKKQESSGGNYTNSMKDSNGALFNRVVAQFYSEEKIGYTEASKLLLCSVEKI